MKQCILEPLGRAFRLLHRIVRLPEISITILDPVIRSSLYYQDIPVVDDPKSVGHCWKARNAAYPPGGGKSVPRHTPPTYAVASRYLQIHLGLLCSIQDSIVKSRFQQRKHEAGLLTRLMSRFLTKTRVARGPRRSPRRPIGSATKSYFVFACSGIPIPSREKGGSTPPEPAS